MKLILIDGGPASGKNTLGELLVKKLYQENEKWILLDLDSYVEEFCPTWVWKNNIQKESDLSNARNNFIKDIDKHLQESFNVVAIGERFLNRKDIQKYVEKLTITPSVYIYHLSVPIELRRERLHKRGPHSLIDLDKDQRERDIVKNWPGYIYQNVNSPEIDASNLYKLVIERVGLLK